MGELHARRGLWDHQFPMALDLEGKTLGQWLSSSFRATAEQGIVQVSWVRDHGALGRYAPVHELTNF